MSKYSHLLYTNWATHRKEGDIPGLILAPRSGIYRPTPIEIAQAENAERLQRFLVANDGNKINPKFRGTHFVDTLPIVGAFGETL